MVVLGDGAVGKTSICMRFTDDYFAPSYKQTVGLDFFIQQVVLQGKEIINCWSKCVEMNPNTGNTNVALQIWDIGGQSVGSKMIQNYIFGAQAVLLVYDITNFESFQNLADWLSIVKKTFANSEEPFIALVANKSKHASFFRVRVIDANNHWLCVGDLQHLRMVKKSRHTAFADSSQLQSFEVSAKTGDKVQACFTSVAAKLAGIRLSRSQLEAASVGSIKCYLLNLIERK